MRILPMVLVTAIATLLGVHVPTEAQGPPVVGVKVDKDGIDFTVATKHVTRYHTKDSLPRPFFWPVKTVEGTETTRAWPMGEALPIEGKKPDHVHHRSVWFCHGDVIPEGMELKTRIKGVEGVDFWSEAKGHGNIVCTKVGTPKIDQAGASVTTHNEWRTAEGDKVLDEDRKITVIHLPKGYVIILDIDLQASVYPITFGDTKEGSMAIRIHPEINVKPGKGKMQNAEGKINEGSAKDPQCWGYKSAWCDYSGPIGDKVVGVAIFDDPSNKYASCWHARDYGLMGANPFGRDKHAKFPAMKGNNDLARLAKGDHLQLRYGVYVHTGDTKDGSVADAYTRYLKMRDLVK